jgi:hypothetical protein
MRRYRLLQVGDVHYPDWEPFQSDVDAKDQRFAPNITESLRSSALRQVLRKIRGRLSKDVFNAVVFMGDFTSRGRGEFLPGAFQHFTLLCRNRGDASESVPLLFVPGNHDVNRDEARDLGATEKFNGMKLLAEKFGWRAVPINQPVKAEVFDDDGKAYVTLINTAIGSWELQNLPEFLRDKLVAADQASAPLDLGGEGMPEESAPAKPLSTKESAPTDLVGQYYGQLDTPYVSNQMMTGLMESLHEPGSTFAVVVGHHNLLPQKTPRITPYAELLNGGFVRSQLLSANKPIIYLHGHIHQDPIEIVSDPHHAHGKLVSISAPEIRSGFNELVFFVSEHGDLVGIRVIPYRSKLEDGTVEMGEQCFISTLPPWRAALDDVTFDLFSKLKDYRAKRSQDLLFWNEVQKIADVGGAFSADALEDALLMLHASQFIEVDGLNKPNVEWRINLRGR